MLEPEGLDIGRAGADEDDAFLGKALRKADILAEEAIAGMHRLGARRLAGGDDGLDVEVALGGRRGAEPDGFVRQRDGAGEAVGIGIDRDRGDPHALERADHPDSDLAPVGNQDLGEHQDAPLPEATAPTNALNVPSPGRFAATLSLKGRGKDDGREIVPRPSFSP